MALKAPMRTVRIELTEEQKEQIRGVLGKEVRALELTPEQLPEELEERVAPGAKPGIASGCN
jgi:hypothetical protein